ncbi:MAG TPA: hypothetical protein PLI93_08840 [Gemmatimonadales bacterium]|nr:hypothetical protein [Gemmatimonadales bacterium]HRX18158.1 hypothetical protein [Gemmatimonadales bacterium]
MDQWNQYLREAPELPTLGTQETGGIPLVGHGNSSDGLYCGLTTPGSGGKVGAIHIYPSSECNGKTGSRAAVLTHEFAHALGWNSGHGNYTTGRTPTTAGCTTFISRTGDADPISSSVCRHDVEALFRAYFNSSGWTWNQAYFNSSILWSTDAPSTVNVPATTTAQVNISKWLGAPSGEASYGNATVNWVPQPSAPFTVSTTGLISAGSSQGSAKLYLKAVQAPPSGYLTWTPFTRKGDSVSVNVTEAPPPPPFRVDSIWASQMPITSPGLVYFYSSVSGVPGSPLLTRWIIRDSRYPTEADTAYYYGTTHSQIVGIPESYTLTISVRPQIEGGSVGLESTQDIPVCTSESFAGGGKGSPQFPISKTQPPGGSGGGSTNAVGGCGGPAEN